jgi:hypothetical protein
MISQNKALLAKLGWKVLKDEDLLWLKSLKQTYLKNTILLSAKPFPENLSIWSDTLIISVPKYKPIVNPSLINSTSPAKSF